MRETVSQSLESGFGAKNMHFVVFAIVLLDHSAAGTQEVGALS